MALHRGGWSAKRILNRKELQLLFDSVEGISTSEQFFFPVSFNYQPVISKDSALSLSPPQFHSAELLWKVYSLALIDLQALHASDYRFGDTRRIGFVSE